MIEMSIVIAIIATVLAMTVSMGSSMVESARKVNTQHKMDQIETALMAFRLANDRLPCPGDLTITDTPANTATFGYEAANLGTCTGGTPAANSIYTLPASTPYAASGTKVAEGAVPVRTLNLPDEFQFDGWGRKFGYAVWTPFTGINAFVNYGVTPNCGGITVENAGHGYRSTAGAYALISYGPDGHGGYTKGGSRYFMKSDNGDEWTNCHCNATADTGYTATYVEEEPTQSNSADSLSVFDDIVRFKERWQMQDAYDTYRPAGMTCIPGFRIDGVPAGAAAGSSVAVGDVNGDGIPDLLIGVPWGATGGVVYVIFGTKNGFPNPLALSGTSFFNGVNGFTLTSDWIGIAGSLAVADIDHDGVGDIIMGSNGYDDGQVTVFYGQQCGGSWPTPCNSSYDTSTLTACQGFYINDGNSGGGMSVVTGDVNGDGIPDIIWGNRNYNGNNGRVYVLFGKNKTCPGSPTFPSSFNPNTLSNSSTPAGAIINGSSGTYSFGNALAVADINKDGYADIIIGDNKYYDTSWNGRVLVVAGQPAANWPSTITDTSLAGIPAGGGGNCPSPYNTCGFVIHNDVANNRFMGYSVATGDVTGDNIADIAVGSTDNNGAGGGYAWVVKGNSTSTAWTSASYEMSTLISGGNAMSFTDGGHLGGNVNIGGGNLFISTNYYGGPPYGSVYVLYGGSSLASRNLSASPLVGTDGFRIDCPYQDNFNGNAPNMCLPGPMVDINDDGVNDFVILVPGGSVTSSNLEGYVYVLYGNNTGWTTPYSLSTIY